MTDLAAALDAEVALSRHAPGTGVLYILNVAELDRQLAERLDTWTTC